jgi:transposase
LDGDAAQARCPQGHLSGNGRLGHDGSGDPVIRSRFEGGTWRGGEMRAVCPRATDAPRQRTVRPQAQHEAIQAARQRQETEEFKTQ